MKRSKYGPVAPSASSQRVAGALSPTLSWPAVNSCPVLNRVPYCTSRKSRNPPPSSSAFVSMEPRALLFDEPTSALDPELEQEVVKVIKALADEGRTMLLVTHDMKLAADCSDHVIFLHKGRIEEEGPPDRLFGNPQTERLRGFLSATA